MKGSHDVGVVILGGGRGSRLEPLTRERAKPAVPVGGKYRLVDIPISNAIHSGYEHMVLLTQFMSHSLHRHIAQTYRFDPFSGGYIHIVAAQQTPSEQRWFQGTADAVRQSFVHIDEIAYDDILVLAGDHMYRMDYRDMYRTHRESGADVTVAVQPCTEAEASGFGILRIDEAGAIVAFREKPRTAADRAGLAVDPSWLDSHGFDPGRPYLASMGIYLFRKRVLRDAIADPAVVDFGHHVIPQAVARGLRVQAHVFDGYWRDIGTIRAFFDAHMDLVGDDPPFRFDHPNWPIFTHQRFLPAARLHGVSFQHAMVAEGCDLEDCTVEEAVIGVRTRARGARIRRALVMGADADPPARDGPPVGIGEGTVIEGAIIDKNARIGRGVRIVNAEQVVDADGPGWAIRGGIVVVQKNAVVPDGTVI